MTASMTPFTVVIPLYNKAEYITDALRSVVAQHSPPAEIIVVDDGSTDDGGAIVTHEFPEATLIRQPNQGVSAARNTGINAASNEWIAFLDSDDVWWPDHLTELRLLTELRPTPGLISTAFIRSTAIPTTPPEPSRVLRRHVDYFDEAARNISLVSSSTAAARRSQLCEAGLFDDFATGEDLLMWAKLGAIAPVAVSSRVTAVYRQAPSSAMATSSSLVAHRPIRTLGDVSPSASFVEQLLRSGVQTTADRTSLQRYLSARAVSKLKVAVVSKDRQLFNELCRALRDSPEVDSRPLRRMSLGLVQALYPALEVAVQGRSRIREAIARRTTQGRGQ